MNARARPYTKRYRPSKYLYQPNIGVKEDFETILHRFSSANTVRYETFAALCREMKLSQYCAGRMSQNEAKEFVEECFQIAVQFWLPPSQFLVRAGALYLLYCLYYYQLVVPKTKIRVTVEMWKEIVEFQVQAREQQHLDLDYVFQRMKLDRAFVFVMTPTDIYPTQKTTPNETRTIPENLKEDSNSVSQVFSSSMLNQLALVHEQYNKMKVVLNDEDSSKPASSLDIIHSDLIHGIYKTLQVHKERQLNISQGYHSLRSKDQPDEDEDNEEEANTTPGSNSIKKELKKKAYEALPGYTRGTLSSQMRTSSMEEQEEEVKRKPNLTPPILKRPGRAKLMPLFEKDDDLEDFSADTRTRIEGLFSMPDISKIIPKTSTDTDAQAKEENKHSKSKGKAPLKGKALKKTRNRKSHVKEEVKEKEPDGEVSSVEQIGETDLGNEVDDSNVDETFDRRGSGTDDESDPVKETSTKVHKTIVKQADEDLVKSDQKMDKAAKKRGKSGDANDLSVPEKVTKVTDEEADKGKRLKSTAQEKLQELINKRKKDARDKKKKKN